MSLKSDRLAIGFSIYMYIKILAFSHQKRDLRVV